MKYLYYPGCSLEGTAQEYNISVKAFMKEIGAELTELPDWTCCGANSAVWVNSLLSLALPAINLAIAEQTDPNAEILVPCSACYLNLKRVEEQVHSDPELLKDINRVLAEKNLELKGDVRVRHFLDVASADIGSEMIRKHLKKPLKNLKIAPYYGCQCIRPYAVFDDPETPSSMEPLLSASCAEIHEWNMGGKCCGASHMNTKTDVGVELVSNIFREAKGADAIVTVCPMCQMNLEAYQSKVSSKLNENIEMTILYLPQLLGLAIGLSESDLGMEFNLSVSGSFRDKLHELQSN